MPPRIQKTTAHLGEEKSDAGAVAARVGFKYQDHVAAHFVLKMIGDRRILQVECETSDDITLIHRQVGKTYEEYIQVKSTDKDQKWNIKELTARSNPDKPTSIAEKSLLCDKRSEDARFRFVARRSVSASLSALLEPVDHREMDSPIAKLAQSFKRARSKTISANNHDLDYWARNLYWDVRPGIDSVENRNLRTISVLSEDSSVSPTHSYAYHIYLELLRMVEAAAVATRKRPDLKIITREKAVAWWHEKMMQARAAARYTAKPYVAKGDRFFAEIHSMEHEPLRKTSSSYDAQFERKKWRSKQLARHLSDWVPEVSLRASELVEIDQLHLRQKLEAGLKAIQAHTDVEAERLLGETLLHAVLRHWFGSEPIACKLFNRSAFGDSVTKNAHIIHTPDGDQLWLGRIRLFRGGDLAALTDGIRTELVRAMETDVLAEERDIILHLREPQHLTSNTLDNALEPGAPIDELIKVLCFPILVAYDSEVLSLGHTDDYKSHLLKEVQDLAQSFVESLPSEIDEVQAHIFLIPIENLVELKKHFAEFVGTA